MDRNGMRNFLYPGPAIPVQILPVSGDPRYSYAFSPGTPIINDNVFLPMHENASSEEATQRNVSRVASPCGSKVIRRETAPAQAIPPARLDHILQRLSHRLDEAIEFCEACLQTHRDVVDTVSWIKHGARNTLWKELLESRFETSGIDKDSFHGLLPRVQRYTQQAHDAVLADPSGRSEIPGDREKHRRQVFKVNKLSAACGWVGQLNKRALACSMACEDMVEEMKEMKELCGKISDGGSREATPQHSQESEQDQ